VDEIKRHHRIGGRQFYYLETVARERRKVFTSEILRSKKMARFLFAKQQTFPTKMWPPLLKHDKDLLSLKPVAKRRRKNQGNSSTEESESGKNGCAK